MESKIFISYRRGDDAGFAHALHAQLMRVFRADDVFMDVQGHIKPGDDFAGVIDQNLDRAEVMLVVIGNRWSEMFARASGRTDWVQYEIASAIERGKRVVPVLVDDAELPEPEDLPEDIRALCSYQTVELRPKRFSSDSSELLAYLERAVHSPAPPPPAPAPKRPMAVPILAGLAVLLIGGLGVAWYTGLIGGDYPSCIEAAGARWEEIRKCAIRHNFSL
ncbi:MAG: toll/interleukin-1 receptor domain-containing protein [Pseudomonadota bacterium]